MNQIFVYGTLRSDDKSGNCRVMARHGGRRTETRATIEAELYDFRGFYPMIRLAPGTGRLVTGEVWEVSDAAMAALDRYEGEMYHRVAVKVTTMLGPVIEECAVYEAANVDGLPLIESGDWINRGEG
jgi:gamma-glutamylcyclotransferase (GGCT)/AIG2-like uncharacterized protein YtfP